MKDIKQCLGKRIRELRESDKDIHRNLFAEK